MFNRLAPPLQRALWEMGWAELREAQLRAIPLILDTRDDVVISAATAAGKCISIKHASSATVAEAMRKIASKACPPPIEVVSRKQAPNPEKWDWVLPDDLFIASYASRALAIEEAHALCRGLAVMSD